MISTYASRGRKKYRYYITHTALKQGHAHCSVGMVRADDIEGIVFDQLKAVFRQPELIVETWRACQTQALSISEHEVRKNFMAIEQLWDHLFHDEQARLLNLFIDRIALSSEGVSVNIKTQGLNNLVNSIQHLNKAGPNVA